MELTEFVRKPFVVEAVEITEDNIAEIAPLVGTLKQKEDGSSYIVVNQHKVPNVTVVRPGSFMTKMGKQIRCYSKNAFNKQFIESNESIQAWITFLNNDAKTKEESDAGA